MQAIKFRVIPGAVMNFVDEALIDPNEGEPLAQVIEAAINGLSTSIEIEIGGIKKHLAAWMDPDHWASEWEEHELEPDEVLGFVDQHMHEYRPLARRAVDA